MFIACDNMHAFVFVCVWIRVHYAYIERLYYNIHSKKLFQMLCVSHVNG